MHGTKSIMCDVARSTLHVLRTYMESNDSDSEEQLELSSLCVAPYSFESSNESDGNNAMHPCIIIYISVVTTERYARFH